jgi:hypothetical protein
VILESIVTTVGNDREINLAPMGPLVANPAALSVPIEDVLAGKSTADPGFVLRPFEGSRTLANLHQTGVATIHVCDDIELFARAALGQLDNPEQHVRRLDDERVVLKNCHQWFAIEAQTIREPESKQFPRFEIACRMVDRGVENTLFGFNRAKHAVLEAAIMATRVSFLPADEIRAAFQTLRTPVEKTAGPREQQIFDWICEEVDRRLASQHAEGSRR